jgi:type II secretory ATPase GspE/PulE/Tfp pilus assembly ATPase PilB-like protein
MGVEPFLISSTLNVVLAQRLVRKLCDDKEKYNFTSSEVKALSKQIDVENILNILKQEELAKPNDSFEDIIFYRPEKGEKESEGYSGRIGIFEVLNISETIKELINQEANTDIIQKRAQQEGTKTMVEDGFIKAAQGITSIEEVLRVIKD